MDSLILLRGLLKKRQLDMAKYRRIMSHPTWNSLSYAVVSTRSYEEGLDAALLLLRYTEENRRRLSQEEYQSNSILLYYFLLAMLDKMDRWEEYLEVWASIRQNFELEFTYEKKWKTALRPADRTLYPSRG